ncbi:unnamed protein product [Paramecium sonneborni]|uniref:Uncharacterized protein n=1 Tax=Paramecium sonneborni TaxID=65129 RepID=A0A8S1RUM5_9CILI|nr:unnamed protein product [Paramecium sonneborni]
MDKKLIIGKFFGIFKESIKRFRILLLISNIIIGGGGDYEEQQGIGQKVGKWIEDSDMFFCWRQITNAGEYKQGEKIGKWEIYNHQAGKNQLVGCGSYDYEGNEIRLEAGLKQVITFMSKVKQPIKGIIKMKRKLVVDLLLTKLWSLLN